MEKPPLPAFTPVPRRYRHDGWTPERQKAFIEALADCGSVTRAAGMVNMAQANCYALRRAPGAEGFRRAWDAALDFGLKRLKDIAFERAIEGQLVPVFVAGKLMGFRRKRNDALLMFCLRHYGQDPQGRRTTINYFSSRATSTSSGQASAGAGAACADGGPPPPLDCVERSPSPCRGGIAEASTTTVRTVITGDGAGPSTGSGQAVGGAREDQAAGVLNGFEGVALDAEAMESIQAALEACAARARALDSARDKGGMAAIDADEDDPDEPFVRVHHGGPDYRGELLPPVELEEVVPFGEDTHSWRRAGDEVIDWVPQVVEAAPSPEPRRTGKKKRDSGSSRE
ncbi:MAG TPA: hypothetical protein VGC46_03380 [Allosphingosinicella sp.]